jgi:hypothetical protein
MNQIARNLLGTLLFAVLSLTTVYSQSIRPTRQNSIERTERVGQVFQHQQPGSSLVEEFSFLIKDFKVDRQSENNNLNISISYRYVANIAKADYPDYRLLTKDVETFLTNYPNEKDYWEIVNKQLTALLLKKYPVLKTITCELTLDPVAQSPYTRSSRVTRERTGGRSKRN